MKVTDDVFPVAAYTAGGNKVGLPGQKMEKGVAVGCVSQCMLWAQLAYLSSEKTMQLIHPGTYMGLFSGAECDAWARPRWAHCCIFALPSLFPRGRRIMSAEQSE